LATSWQPTSDKNMLQARAALLREVRHFFAERQVLETDTPILSNAAGTDPTLEPVSAALEYPDSSNEFYLQTSPEFAMKRLLAAGSGPIYQLAKSFRKGEVGKLHNPEFTMLEWYRPGYSMTDLMDEVESLVQHILGTGPATRITYTELFSQFLDINPMTASVDDLLAIAKQSLDISMESSSKDTWLDLLFSHCIQPQLHGPTFVTHYPPSQAALAEVALNEEGVETALRFELIVQTMELANGYQELTDPVEQARRFDNDLAVRKIEGLQEYPADQHLIAALEHGLPDCAGVALGFDRLLMLKTGAESIAEVISFPIDRA